MDLLEEMQVQAICGDAAMGTRLIAQGFATDFCFEQLCVSDPARIGAIHDEDIRAGARVIRTNSFGANAVRLARCGAERRVAEINERAAPIAVRAARGHDVYVAGSVGPLSLSADQARARGVDRRECFRQQIAALVAGGVQVILFETFTTLAEMVEAYRAAKEVTDAPCICSFACSNDGFLNCGISVADAFAELERLGVAVMGLNCVVGTIGIMKVLPQLTARYLVSVYPSAGIPREQDGRFRYSIKPEQFGRWAERMVDQGVRLVGGCCGTTSEYVREISRLMGSLSARRLQFV